MLHRQTILNDDSNRCTNTVQLLDQVGIFCLINNGKSRFQREDPRVLKKTRIDDEVKELINRTVKIFHERVSKSLFNKYKH